MIGMMRRLWCLAEDFVLGYCRKLGLLEGVLFVVL